MIKKIFRINSGFTLIELLISLAVIAVIAIVSSQILISLVSTSVNVQRKNDIEQSYTIILQKLTKIIQDGNNASSASSSANLNAPLQVNSVFDIICFRLLNNELQMGTNQLTPCSSLESNSYRNLTFSNTVIVSSINSTTPPFFISSSNPVQVRIRLKFTDPLDPEFSQEVDRTVTLRKTYKNF